MIMALASCGGGTDNLVPGTKGGVGTVISLNGDGAVGNASGIKADGGRDVPAVAMGGTGAVGGAGSGGGTGSGGTGSGAGPGGAAGGAIASGGGAGNGGAGGGGPPDDPCTACEKAKCSHPAGLTSNKGDAYALLVGAYEVCFLGTGWPSASVDPSVACGGLQGETGTAATNGPERGTAKTTLCQDLLKCVHQTNCTGGEDVDNQFQCYCGAGVTIQSCSSSTFVATGVCMDQLAGALESTEFSNSENYFGDVCLANGAAFHLYDFCDANCCESACGLPPTGFEDPTFCNAAGTGGASGSGGTTGVGGRTGTGGSPGAGSGGNPGTGGATQSGGTSGSGGILGTGGGAVGSGGSTGGGGAGDSGSAGSSGLQNVHFDANVASWTASLGATISRSTNDADGSVQSGSLDLVVAGGDPTISAQFSASQCLSVTAGTIYDLGVSILIPGQTGSQGLIGLSYYVSADCSGSVAGLFSSSSFTPTTWQTFNYVAVIPAGVDSIAVKLIVQKPSGQTSAEALFDDVVVKAQ